MGVDEGPLDQRVNEDPHRIGPVRVKSLQSVLLGRGYCCVHFETAGRRRQRGDGMPDQPARERSFFPQCGKCGTCEACRWERAEAARHNVTIRRPERGITISEAPATGPGQRSAARDIMFWGLTQAELDALLRA